MYIIKNGLPVPLISISLSLSLCLALIPNNKKERSLSLATFSWTAPNVLLFYNEPIVGSMIGGGGGGGGRAEPVVNLDKLFLSSAEE